jgi:hypothetical protein
MQRFVCSTRVHGDLDQSAPVAVATRRETPIDESDEPFQPGALISRAGNLLGAPRAKLLDQSLRSSPNPPAIHPKRHESNLGKLKNRGQSEH